MELTEDEIFERHGKPCGHCNGNTLLPYEYGWTCISCGFSLIKRKHDLTKLKRKKINFINRLKDDEQKVFCNCIDVYVIYEGNDFDNLYEVFSTLKKN